MPAVPPVMPAVELPAVPASSTPADGADAALAIPAPPSFGNVNIVVRVLSPGDDGPVIQTATAPAVSPVGPAHTAAPPITWTWTWNWTWSGGPVCEAPVVPTGSVGASWTWDWTWDCTALPAPMTAAVSSPFSPASAPAADTGVAQAGDDQYPVQEPAGGSTPAGAGQRPGAATGANAVISPFPARFRGAADRAGAPRRESLSAATPLKAAARGPGAQGPRPHPAPSAPLPFALLSSTTTPATGGSSASGLDQIATALLGALAFLAMQALFPRAHDPTGRRRWLGTRRLERPG
jgi:hypothetical protein